MAKDEEISEDVELVEDGLPEGPDYSSESDLLFRTQMRIADAFYAHWKKGLGLLIAFLTAVLGYGLWSSGVEADQKEASKIMAALDRKLPAVNLIQLQGGLALDDPSDAKRTKLLAGIAGKYHDIAQAHGGTASLEAAVKAGDTWMRAGEPEKAKESYEFVLSKENKGLFAVAAHNGIAGLALSQKNHPVAIEHYQAVVDGADGILAEEALLNIARAARAGGNLAQASQALDTLTTRFPNTMRMSEVDWERKKNQTYSLDDQLTARSFSLQCTTFFCN